MGTKRQKCLIISAGEIIKPIKEIINPSDFDCIIACDGGYDYCVKNNIIPNILIGDFDSVKSPLPQNTQIIKLKCEKDDTDTISAIRKAKELCFDEFVLLGALGGRIDHSFANIYALVFADDLGIKGKIISETTEIFILHNEKITLEPQKNKTISIFSATDICENVSLINLKYPLNNAVLKSNFPLGISNEFTDLPCTISIEKGILVIILTEK